MANITGTSGNNTLVGGVGADTLTGLGGNDIFVFAAGGSTLSIGGSGVGGTISGFDTITDFTAGATVAQSEKLQFTGADLAGNTNSSHGTTSTLRLNTGATVTAHSIANGVISFDDDPSNKFTSAVRLTSMSDVAAVVQYLQGTGFGAGKTVSFAATIAGVTHTFVFIQGNGAGTDSQDVLVDLLNVTATSLSVDKATGQISLLDTAPPAAPQIAIPENASGGLITKTEAQDGTAVVVALVGTGAIATDKITVTWGGQVFTYALTAADIIAGQASVSIPAATLAALGSGAFNVAVTITDGAGNVSAATTAAVSVALATAPFITTNGGGDAAAISIPENTSAVTQVQASDPGGLPLTYAIVGGADQALFDIDQNGFVTFKTAPDFEAPTDAGQNNVYDLVVKVTNSQGDFDTQAIAVNVSNVAEAPPGAPATNLWGDAGLTPAPVTTAAGSQVSPAIADHGGAQIGVAWIDGSAVTISFFDERGRPDPATPSAVLTDGVGSSITDLQMVAGGVGVGFGVAWSETNGGGNQLKLRYYDTVSASVLGPEIAISANAGANQHDLAISSYLQDDPATRKPVIDGFDVAWVEGAGAAHALGAVFAQRFGAPLDAKKDPSGPPAATGLDGSLAGSNAQVLVAANGRDPSIAGLVGAANETVVTWVNAANQINIQVFNDNGTVDANPLGVATGDVATAAAPLAVGGQQHLLALAGGGFVLAWVATLAGGNNVLEARVFTPGAAAGAFTASPLIQLDPLDGASNGITDFSLAALPDGGGFAASWTAADAGTQAIFSRSFTAGGVAQEPLAAIFHAPANAANIASTGMLGDRFMVVYQDDSTAGDPSNIIGQIFDTRVDPAGNPIRLNGVGVTMVGDVGRVLPDVLVGTIAQDYIDGGAGDDILDGALGDDTFIAGAGNDAINGGGGSDTLVLSGRFSLDGVSTNDDYIVTSAGNGVFTIVDKRANGDGSDVVRDVETFQFLGNTPGAQIFTAAQLSGERPNVTPTAWGWSNADGDTAPNAAGLPDVDGFVVNHATTAGIQKSPSVADSVGEFVGVVWETASGPGADTHIRGQFYDVIGAFDSFIPNAINLSDGVGIETNPVITSGGANSGWGVAWEQRDNAADASREIRTNFVGPGQLTSTELSVLNEGPTVDQHDVDLSESMLDRTLASPAPGSVLPAGMNDGYNVVWISTHLDGSDGALPSGYGRVMLQRFEVPLDALGNPGAPKAGGVDGVAGLGADAAVWVGDEDANNVGGFFGRNPSSAALHTFESGLVWVAQDGLGGEKVMFRAYDDIGQVIGAPLGADLSAGFGVAAGTNAQIASAGAVNFVVAWISADATSPSGFSVMGRMLSSAGAGLNGQGFGFGASDIFTFAKLPTGFVPGVADFHLTGISGEDSNDVIVSWNLSGDVQAQHVSTILDPVTGIALSMAPEGSIVTVNAATAGVQDHAGLAGLLGDRFIAVYHDANNVYTDGDDIVARIMDTRDPSNPEPILGDLVRPDGSIQARRDVLVGTNGDDLIRGDLSDANGLVDWIYGGMGDDVIQGGPGLRGAAGVPEIIDGGEGTDIAVYTGRLQDYSITVTGDGGFEIIDLRPTADAAGNPLPNDGIDNLTNVEKIRFLDLANNGAGAQTIDLRAPGAPPPPPANYNGTPVPWSLDDTSQYKEIVVDHGAGAQTGVSVANLQDGAGLAWVSGGGSQVWAIAYDVTGKPDPVLLDQKTQLTDGSAAGNTVSHIDLAMTAGLGMTVVWESSTATDTSIHYRFASTNTHVVLDPAGGVPGPGLPGGEGVVVGSDGLGVAAAPTIQGYEIVNVDNDTLEVGFHVAYAMKGGVGDANPGDAYGTLEFARYEIPVYDILVDAAGLPILNPATQQGQLATDASGNFIPATAATFGRGSETAPRSIGLDGLRGTADDGAAIILTDQGLRAANNLGGATPLLGRNMTIGSLHDGQLVATYIGADERVHLKVFLPSINETGDRETGGLGGVDVVATGVTTYSEFALPFPTTFGAVASGQSAYTVAQQNGSFGVFWAEANALTPANVDIKGIIFAGAGTNWSPSAVTTFETNLPGGVGFQIAPTGVTPAGLEDGFFVSWQTATGIQGQRFDMSGAKVGQQIIVGDPGSGTPGIHSSTGIDDGRMLVAYEDSGDVSAQYLDNREPGVINIGPRVGAPRDVLVGTVGDDALDGRALSDQLYGGLGDDLITLGSGADIGFGGLGDDTLIGGSGQDQLLGEAGNDLLVGGANGAPDPKVEGLLPTTAANNAPVVDPDGSPRLLTGVGVDLISGGPGVDTISYEGEFGKFDVDLVRGVTFSDRGVGAWLAEDVIGAIITDAAGVSTFTYTHDIENVVGGLGDDTIRGDDAANSLSGMEGDDRLEGRRGDDAIDGGAGQDTAALSGKRSDYVVVHNADGSYTVTGPDGVDTIRNVEFLAFLGDTGVNARVAIDSFNTSAPVAAADAKTLAEDTPTSLDLLANDAANGDPIRIVAVNGAPITVGAAPIATAHGSVVLNSDGTLGFTPERDYFGAASFTYQIANARGVSEADVNLTITPVNDAPTGLTPTQISVPENSTVVATLAAIDVDQGDTFSYALLSGGDANFFTLDPVTGALKFIAPPNFESASHGAVYAIKVQVTDSGAASIVKDVLVTVTNVDEAPLITSAAVMSIAETHAVASPALVVGSVTATDPEGGPTSLSLVDSADGRFALVGGQLVVANAALIDFEDPSNPGHAWTVTLQASDAAGHVSLQAITVQVTNGATVETIVGGATTGNNVMTGTAGSDVINGLAGQDTMTGLAGNDVYFVDNAGDKVVEAANGGVDLIYTSLAKFDMNAAANVETLIYTGAGAFQGIGASSASNTLVGGAGADTLSGGNQADTLIGGDGADSLTGGNGDDRLFGGAGADTINGGNGADRIEGGSGNDTLTGGAGNDTFYFGPGFGRDVITDFSVGAGNHDILELSRALFASADDVLAHAAVVGGNLVITAGADTITLQKVTTLSAVDLHLI